MRHAWSLRNCLHCSGFIDKYNWVSSTQQWKFNECVLIMFPSGSIYIENKIGLSTEPCGTPWLTLVRTDDLLICTNWNQSDKYDWNQLRAVPLMLINCCSLCNKMWWSLVSNAALRSNRTRTDTNPWSEAIRRSFVTFAKAVSVLWLGLKPDWKSSYTLLSLTNSHSRLATTFSRISDRKGRLDIGLWFAKTSGSRVDFLRRGLITASLKDCGTCPDDNDRLIVFSKVLSIRVRISLSNFVGMGSKIQVVGLEHTIILVSWSRLIWKITVTTVSVQWKHATVPDIIDSEICFAHVNYNFVLFSIFDLISAVPFSGSLQLKTRALLHTITLVLFKEK